MADIVMQRGSDPALDDIDDKALNALLDAFDPSNPDAAIAPVQAEVTPEPPVEVPVEAPPVEAAPVEEAPAEPVAEEIDLSASEREGERIARAELQAKLTLLEAHNSRLAGKLGFFEQKLKSIPTASEPYEPQSQGEIDRLTALEQRLADSEAKRSKTEVSQAVESALAALDGPWSKELAAEIQVIAPKYQDHMKSAIDSGDPELARLTATAVGMLVEAEAKKARWESTHKTLVEKKAATVTAAASAKRAATVSGSGAVPAPPPKPVSVADMTIEQADAWLKANVR